MKLFLYCPGFEQEIKLHKYPNFTFNSLLYVLIPVITRTYLLVLVDRFFYFCNMFDWLFELGPTHSSEGLISLFHMKRFVFYLLHEDYFNLICLT